MSPLGRAVRKAKRYQVAAAPTQLLPPLRFTGRTSPGESLPWYGALPAIATVYKRGRELGAALVPSICNIWRVAALGSGRSMLDVLAGLTGCEV